jgi:hypothetical protein
MTLPESSSVAPNCAVSIHHHDSIFRIARSELRAFSF